MILHLNDIQINVEVDESQLNNGKNPIIFLHGFTGSVADWLNITKQINKNYLPISIDLVGHGKSSSPEMIEEYTSRAQVYYIKMIIDHFGFDKVTIAGYSMGARVALSFALLHPEYLKCLILESTTPGIIKDNERKERTESDLKLSQKILKIGVPNFIDEWMLQPIFKNQGNLSLALLEEIKKQKYSNSKTGLVNTLRGFSTGLMPSYWSQLNQLNFPVLLITGALDLKYTEINKQAKTAINNCNHSIIENCGHNVHLENESAFVNITNNFLNTT